MDKEEYAETPLYLASKVLFDFFDESYSPRMDSIEVCVLNIVVDRDMVMCPVCYSSDGQSRQYHGCAVVTLVRTP